MQISMSIIRISLTLLRSNGKTEKVLISQTIMTVQRQIQTMLLKNHAR